MAEESAKLRIPYIAAAQAQKHVTHNEAMTLLDTLVQLSVLDKDLTAPPMSPAEGDTYIVAATATGAWLGWEDRVARFIDGAWRSYLPGAGDGAGWLAYVIDEAALYAFDGTDWVIAGLQLGQYVDLAEISPPANPGANVARLYAIDDGGTTKLAFRDSAGTETVLGEAAADVVSAASAFANDNRLLRSDGTLRGAQASGIDCDDSANLSGIGTIAFGGQLAFPASQSPSAGANTLDDYEEGTFTPAITFGGGATGITYGAQTGAYTKIGNRVLCTIRLALSNKGTSTGAAVITGLPFAPATRLGVQGYFDAIGSGAGMLPQFFADNGGTTITCRLFNQSTGANSNADNSHFTNTTTYYLPVVYDT